MALIMEWFKVVKDNQLVGAVTDQSFARYSPKSGQIIVCKAVEGQYIIVNDKYYRDNWMMPLDQESTAEWEPAIVVSISEKEYNMLVKADPTEPINERMLINAEPEDISEKMPKAEEVATIEFIRERKLKELNKIFNEIIENGFDLVLSDGVSHHFSLTTNDQMNLIDLQRAVDTNDDLIYHADDELIQFYSFEDAQDILVGARKWKQYNMAVFNSMKNWINSVEDISIIDAIHADSEIPEEYCTIVLQMLTENF